MSAIGTKLSTSVLRLIPEDLFFASLAILLTCILWGLYSLWSSEPQNEETNPGLLYKIFLSYIAHFHNALFQPIIYRYHVRNSHGILSRR